MVGFFPPPWIKDGPSDKETIQGWTFQNNNSQLYRAVSGIEARQIARDLFENAQAQEQ